MFDFANTFDNKNKIKMRVQTILTKISVAIDNPLCL